MATVLILNGTQVFPDGKQQIKLIRENPYFTQSESYTLDVTLPMDILENRQFFGNLQRMEQSKQASVMTCRLTVDNKPLLQGSAKVTQVTEKDVKVQLIGGISEIKFLSNENKTYIDEIKGTTPTEVDLGNGSTATWELPDANVDIVYMPTSDETYEYDLNIWNMGWHNDLGDLDRYYGEAPQPCLVDIMKKVLKEQGYEVVENSTDVSPWNKLYIASAKRTTDFMHALPHWTVKEFVEEYCKFFNCSIITNEIAKTVRIVSNSTYFGTARQKTIEPVDEYTVEMNDDSQANSLRTDNLSFDMSGSSEHDYDIIPDNVRDSAPYKEYESRSAALAAYNQMGAEERKKYIFKTPVGLFAGWGHSMSEENGQNVTQEEFTQIDVFGPLIRNEESDSETVLKIVPVAIEKTVLQYGWLTLFGEHHPVGMHPWRYISIENPTGNEYKRWGQYSEDSTIEENDATIQDYVEGEMSIEKSEKEDRMQVFFVDDIEMASVSYAGWDKDQAINALMPFTDFLYKRMYGTSHRQWSLSLNPTAAEHYLGELHNTGYTFNMKAKYCVKFLADEMPDPTLVFIIRNKRFGCEKIEAQIDDRGLQQLMTGYFYEML